MKVTYSILGLDAEISVTVEDDGSAFIAISDEDGDDASMTFNSFDDLAQVVGMLSLAVESRPAP